MRQNRNFTAKKSTEMIRKLIAFSILLVTIVSCTKIDTPDLVDYGPIDKKIIQDYLTVHNDTTAKSTTSGLYYIIQNPGGSAHPLINSTVTVKYSGYLVDGNPFDSSSTPYTNKLYNLITGWQEGLQLIGAGGKMRLFIPSGLGYGATAIGSIPAHSVLIFDIELVSFK